MDEAITAYRKALHYRPDFDSAKENLDRAMKSKNKPEKGQAVTDHDRAMASMRRDDRSRTQGTKPGRLTPPHGNGQAHGAESAEQSYPSDSEDDDGVIGRLSSSMQSFWGAAGF